MPRWDHNRADSLTPTLSRLRDVALLSAKALEGEGEHMGGGEKSALTMLVDDNC